MCLAIDRRRVPGARWVLLAGNKGVKMYRRILFAAILLAQAAWAQKITINYPTRTGQIWPLYLAKEGGYYQKYGLDASLVFGVHPAGIAMIGSGDAVMTAY